MLQTTLFRPTPSDRPVLHLHSWAWVHARVREGKWAPKGRPPVGHSGRAYTIMARPNPLRGELGDGVVRVLVPTGPEVEQMQVLVAQRRLGRADHELLTAYRAAMETRWSAGGGLEPGALAVHTATGPGRVEHGDVLCCACAASEALAGRCHRAWAAPFLVWAGWSVILDGVEVLVEDR